MKLLALLKSIDAGHLTESLDDVYTTMEVESKTQTWDSFFDEMRAAWIGGVADFGNPDAARVIQTHPEYYEYHDQLRQAITQHLGDPFTAYRLMAQDQVEEWQSGSDMPAVAVSLEKRVAVAFRNLAGNKGRGDLILVELTIPAEAVIMLGHEGEHELVIDPNHISANEIKPLHESLMEVRGPHEGKELDLMLSGKKPLAMIDIELLSNREEAKWGHAVATGKIIYRHGINVARNTNYFTLPGEEWRADKIREVFQGVRDRGSMERDDHIALGKLFGYSDEDIEHFVSGIDPANGMVS